MSNLYLNYTDLSPYSGALIECQKSYDISKAKEELGFKEFEPNNVINVHPFFNSETLMEMYGKCIEKPNGFSPILVKNLSLSLKEHDKVIFSFLKKRGFDILAI